MIKAMLKGKIYRYEFKETTTGKKYLDVLFSDSIKVNGQWENRYIYLKVWDSIKEVYDNAVKKLATIKTISEAKGTADVIEIEATVKAVANYKTKEPEIEYSLRDIRVIEHDHKPVEQSAQTESNTEDVLDEERPF